MVEDRLLAEVAEVDPYSVFFLNLFNLPKPTPIKDLERAIYEFYSDVPACGVNWVQDTIDVKFNTLPKFRHAISKGDPSLQGIKVNIRTSLTVGYQENRRNDQMNQKTSKFQTDKQYNQDSNYGHKDKKHQKDGYNQSNPDNYPEQYGAKYPNQKYEQYPSGTGKKSYEKTYIKDAHAYYNKDSTTHEFMPMSKDNAVYSKHEKQHHGSKNYQAYEKSYEDTYKYGQERYYYDENHPTAKYDNEGYHDTYNKSDQYKESSKRHIKDFNYGKDASHNSSQFKEKSKKSPVESKYQDEARVPAKEFNQKYDYEGVAKWTKPDEYNYYNYEGYNQGYKYNDEGENYYDSKKIKPANKEINHHGQYDQYDQLGADYYGYYNEGQDHGHPQARVDYKKQAKKHQPKHNYENDGQYGAYEYQKNLDFYDYNNPRNPRADEHNSSSHKNGKKVKEYDCTGGSSFVVREVPKVNERPRETHSSVQKLAIVAESGYQKGTATPNSDSYIKPIAASSFEQYDYRQKNVKSRFQNESYAFGGPGQSALPGTSKKVSLLEQLQPDISKQPSKPSKKEEQTTPQYSFYGATANDIAKLYSQENKTKQAKPEVETRGADLRKISEEENDEFWGRKRFFNNGKINNKKLFTEKNSNL